MDALVAEQELHRAVVAAGDVRQDTAIPQAGDRRPDGGMSFLPGLSPARVGMGRDALVAEQELHRAVVAAGDLR